MMPTTIVMRSYNDAALLPRTLAAIERQEGVDWRLHVLESASSDGSPEILQTFLQRHGGAAAGHRFTALEPGSYRSSRVLNRAMGAVEGGDAVFLNSDAVLEGTDALRRLLEALHADPRRAGVFGAQTVRPGASTMTRMEYAVAFGNRARLGAAAGWMSLVVSAIRCDAWRHIPFDERLTFAEDAVWSVAVARQGWTTAFVPEVRAEHSHDYTPQQRYRRCFGDAAALACIADRPPPGAWAGLWKPLVGRLVRDAILLLRMGRPWHAVLLPAHHWPRQRGAWDGARAGWATWSRDPTADQALP